MSKQWTILDEPPQSFFDEHPDLPKVVATLLYHRGITASDKIDEFLSPDYSNHVYDPFLFRYMQTAVERIFTAISEDETITIYGDYDADGVTASTILTTVLEDIGAKDVDVLLPHRETDGYGMNKKNVQMLADEGTTLIITCDCGISNTDEIQLAKNLGVDVIVTDHHAIPDVLPPAIAMIHPKLEGETYPDHGLAGAGVAFKLAQALLAQHAQNGKELLSGETHEAAEKWLLGLVAIASVADMVPLLGESRTLTMYGLIVLNKTKRIGMKKLLLEAKLMHNDGSMKKQIDTRTIGFQIAPRINAAGRMNHANVAYRLLVSKDPIEATDLAFELDKNNRDRQQLVEKILEQAEDQIESQKDNPVLVVHGASWPTGIVGLIASKLKEKYYKPSIALGRNNDDEPTGSGRSIEGFNMIEALQEIPEHFCKFGGHPMACGFTLKQKDGLEAFRAAIIEKYTEKTKHLDMAPTVKIDAEIDLDEINWELYDMLQKFEPFGKDNEKPLYLSRNLEVFSAEAMGKSKTHMRLVLKHANKMRKAVAWNMCGRTDTSKTDWCKVLQPGDHVDIVYDIDVNEWNGNRELQLTVRDIKKSE